MFTGIVTPITEAIREHAPAFAGLLKRYVAAQEKQADALHSLASYLTTSTKGKKTHGE